MRLIFYEEGMMPFPSSIVVQVFDVLELYRIPAWLDGGWGVDALLNEQSREHQDVDLIIPIAWLDAAESRLAVLGFSRNCRETNMPTRFVMNNPEGLEIDIHPVEFLADGSAKHMDIDQDDTLYAYIYSAAGLMGIGKVNGRLIRCTTAEEQVRQKLERRYSPWNADRIRSNGISSDIADINNLQSRFTIDVPTWYFENYRTS